MTNRAYWCIIMTKRKLLIKLLHSLPKIILQKSCLISSQILGMASDMRSVQRVICSESKKGQSGLLNSIRISSFLFQAPMPLALCNCMSKRQKLPLFASRHLPEKRWSS